MANLTKDWIRSTINDLPVRRQITAPVKANTVIFAGTLVAVLVANNTGWAQPATGDNTTRVIGVCGILTDNTGGQNGDRRVSVNRGNFPFHNDSAGSPVKAENLGQVCFVLDDNTMTMANTGQQAGKVTGLSPDGTIVEVEIV